MDTPRKRGLFGGFSFFGRAAAEPLFEAKPKENQQPEQSQPSLQRVKADATSLFESPAKRATEQQMSSRKIIDRPQGPSGRLGNLDSSSARYGYMANGVTPKRMPGDNPFATYSDASKRMPGDMPGKISGESKNTASVGSSWIAPAELSRKYPLKTPGRVSGASTFSPAKRAPLNFSGAATISTPRRLGASTARPGLLSTPTYDLKMRKMGTPNSISKGSKFDFAESDTRASMSSLEPAHLFHMRIPEPPAELTGEALVSEIPKDHSKPRSIFADEYLAHHCPAKYNDFERRQFFCILDLRRLKAVAEEIFRKADWKVNIGAFAREYDKSRNLIMYRYGLYEFKTVRNTENVNKEWMAKHGVPYDADAGTGTSAVDEPRPTLGSKRKAEEEPTQDDAASQATSTAKRARASDRVPLAETSVMASNANKRKALSPDPEEVQPTKLHKPVESTPAKPPSGARLFMEQIANKRDNAPSPAQPAAKTSSIFASPAKAPNGNASQSVLGSGVKPLVNNIFGHLSDNGKGSDNDGADEDSGDEADSGAEAEPEALANVEKRDSPFTSNGQGAFAGFAAAAKTKLDTNSGVNTNGSSSAASSDGEGGRAQSRSLFDRVQYGADGQLKRQGTPSASNAPPLEKEKATILPEKAPSPVKEQPSAPANNTWNMGTPIKFAPAGSAPAFGSPLAKAPEEAPKPADEPPKSTASSLFGSGASTPKPNLFGAAPSAPTTNLFASSQSTTADVDQKDNAAPASSASSLFGAKPQETGSETPKPFLFGQTTSAATPATPAFGQAASTKPAAPAFGQAASATPAAPSALFGQPKPATSAEPSSLFAQTTSSASPAISTLFAQPTPTTSAPAFGTTASTTFGSGTSTPAFGQKPTTTSTTASLFGTKPQDSSSTAAKSVFGATTPATTSSPTISALFGAKSNGLPAFGQAGSKNDTETRPDTAKSIESSLFVTPAGSDGIEASKPGVLQSQTLFGKSTAAASVPATPLFGAVKPAETTSTSAASLFGNATNGSKTGTTPSAIFGQSAAAAQPSTKDSDSERLTDDRPAKRTAFGGSGDDKKPMFSFGASTPAPAASIFANPPEVSANNGSTTPLFGVTPASQPAPSQSGVPIFGFGGSSAAPSQSTGSASFTFGTSGETVKNPFEANFNPTSISFDFGTGPSADSSTAASSFIFGGNSQPASQPIFGASTATPTITFGASGTSTPSANPSFSFGANTGTTAGADANAGNIFGFGGLAPAGGTSTGTNTPFTFGGASSLATTPATGTPEPGTEPDGAAANKAEADGDDAPQTQISLTDGGPGEEDESVVHEVRAKAVKLVTAKDEDSDDKDDDDSSTKDKAKTSKSPWKTQGVGPLRLLKHKTTGAVRMLLRAEPRGHVALNKLILPNFNYKPESDGSKYVKIATSSSDGKSLETWMLQVKTPALAKALAEALEANKDANKK